MTAPYERVQLFSGGGSRFGYYLGSYAALVEQGHTPDLILATCGGSLSALLVQIAPDPNDLRQLIRSRELYEVICRIQHIAPTERSYRLRYRSMVRAITRWQGLRSTRQRHKQQRADSYAGLLDELQQLAMFEIAGDDNWLDALIALAPDISADCFAFAPDTAIIASRLCQTQSQYSEPVPHQSAAQLQEILFAPQRLRASKQQAIASYSSSLQSEATHNEPPTRQHKSFLTDDVLLSPVHTLAAGRVHPQVLVHENWDFAAAVRASMADMYYLPPTHIQTLGWCLGGVINLTPIELACRLGDTVFAETKAGYDSWLAAPAIRRVFGFDPNMRLAQVHAHQTATQQLHWLPFADNAEQLARQQVQKRLHLKTATVQLIHSDYDGFVRQMQAQWAYGYQRTAAYIEQHLSR